MEQQAPPANPTAEPTQPPVETFAGDAKHCAEVLLELVDIGRDLARMVLQEVQTQTAANQAAAAAAGAPATSATPAQDAILAFERIARAVRRTVMLHDRLCDPRKKPSPAHRTAARRKIIREVEDAIHASAPEDQQEALHAELIERLDRPELDEEIAERPISDIVTDICRDFGIAHLPATQPWRRRMPHHVAIVNARAEQLPGAAPSAELVALLATAPPQPRLPPLRAKLSDELRNASLERLKRWT